MSTNPKRAEYTARIHRVMDYIEANLDGDLSGEELARVANFSRFHFHRIFRGMVGETTTQFVGRLRIERAAGRLLAEPTTPVTEVALDLGFSSPSTFARAFKAHYGVSATEWREDSKNRKAMSKVSETKRKLAQATSHTRFYVDASTKRLVWEVDMNGMKGEIEVVECEPRTVAYVRHTGPFQGQPEVFAGLFGRLMKWAVPNGIFEDPEARTYCVYHDHPEITQPENLRVSACVSAKEDAPVSGEVNLMQIAGGRYAVGAFKVAPDGFADAWAAIFGGWMPESGFVPDDRPSFERYESGQPDEDGCWDVRIYVPVKPMT